jgi:hypothetical protein
MWYNPSTGCTSKEDKVSKLRQDGYSHVHCITSHSSQEVETTEVPIIWGMDEQYVVPIHRAMKSHPW